MFELAQKKLIIARQLRNNPAASALRCLIGDVETSGDKSNENVVDTARKHLKSLSEMIEIYTQMNRDITGLKEQEESLQCFMPPAVTEEHLAVLLEGCTNIGQAMKTVKAFCVEHQMMFDGNQVKAFLNRAK